MFLSGSRRVSVRVLGLGLSLNSSELTEPVVFRSPSKRSVSPSMGVAVKMYFSVPGSYDRSADLKNLPFSTVISSPTTLPLLNRQTQRTDSTQPGVRPRGGAAPRQSPIRTWIGLSASSAGEVSSSAALPIELRPIKAAAIR